MSYSVSIAKIPQVAAIIADAEQAIMQHTGARVRLLAVKENYIIGAYDLLEIVCKSLNISIVRIRAKGRSRELTDAKKVFCLLGKMKYNFTVVEMARLLNIHHTSVIAAHRKAIDYLQYDEVFKDKYNIVINNLKDEEV